MNKLVITLDSSQIYELIQCPRMWAYHYSERLRKTGEKTFYVDRGSMTHKLLEFFYILRSLNPKEDRFKHWNQVRELFAQGKLMTYAGLTKEDEKFILDRLLSYVIKWMPYDFVPMRRNGRPGVEVGFSKVFHETRNSIFIIEGKIDLLSYTPHGFHCFVDNKTQERQKEYYAQKPQFLIYSWATGYKWGFVNYIRFMQKYDEKETLTRTMFYVNEKKRDFFMKGQVMDAFRYVENILIENGLKDQTEIKGEMVHQNFAHCGGAYETGGCRYNIICDNFEDGPKYKDFLFYKGEQWKPWEVGE